MSLKLGNLDIKKAYLGSIEIKKAYLGDIEVLSAGGTPWDIESLVLYGTKNMSAYDNTITGMTISPDGHWIVINGNQNGVTRKFKMTTYMDITTLVDASQTGIGNNLTGGVFIDVTGTKMYVQNNSSLVSVSLSTPWEISPFTYINQNNTLEGYYRDNVLINPTGTKVYMTQSDSIIYEYSMSTPWDINTAGSEQQTYYPEDNNGFVGMALNNDGTKFYTLSRYGTIYEYDLSTPYNTTTQTYTGISKNLSLSYPCSLWISPDGLNFFVSEISGNIHQYKVS